MLMDSDSIKAPAVTKTMPHATPWAISAKQQAVGAIRLRKKGRAVEQKQELPVICDHLQKQSEADGPPLLPCVSSPSSLVMSLVNSNLRMNLL